MRKKSNAVDMLSGTLFDKILLFALPLAASSILQQVFNSADIAVVGHFSADKALAVAAVGSNSPIINLIINLFLGLSTGANVVTATFIGQGRGDLVKTAVHTSILVSLVSGVFLALAGPLIATPILSAINTPDNVLPLASLYLRIYFLAMPAIMVYNFGSAVLRANGDSRRPLYALFAGGVLNVLLNLFFVIVLGMSVDGVAVATVISNVISAALVISFLVHEEEPLKLNLRKLSCDRDVLSRIAKIGLPAGLQGMVFSISNICIQGGVNSFGPYAMAGSAAAQNFESFSFLTVNAFTQAATTFTSQNYGARNFDRCRKIFRISMLLGIASSAILCSLFVGFREALIPIYTADENAIDFAMRRMLIAPAFHFLTATYEIPAGALRGIGHSALPAVLTLLGTCAFRILWLVTVFRSRHTFETLLLCYPLSWIITGIAVFSCYMIIRRKAFRSPAPAS